MQFLLELMENTTWKVPTDFRYVYVSMDVDTSSASKDVQTA